MIIITDKRDADTASYITPELRPRGTQFTAYTHTSRPISDTIYSSYGMVASRQQ